MDIPNFNNIPNAPMGQQAPEVSGGQILTGDQKRQNLQSMMGKIDNKMKENRGVDLVVNSKIKQAGGEALRMIFDVLRKNGVNPNDVDAVGKFLSKVKETNPEASQKLEEILGSLIGEESTENNMNIINNDQTQETI